MNLTPGQQTELEKPVVRIAFFVEFRFLTKTVYLSSLGQTISWGGHEWVGFGAIGNIGSVDESLGTAASALTFQLNLAQIEWLALATGDTAEYRGRDAKLYFCPLNESFQLVDTPVICWRGTMDTMQASITGEAGDASAALVLKCETSAYGLKRKSSLRLNAMQHKQRHPLDTGFDYLVDLLGNPDGNIWVSKLFQMR